jgi:hypothetical protein
VALNEYGRSSYRHLNSGQNRSTSAVTVSPIAKCIASHEGSDRPGIFTARAAAMG